MPESLQDSSNNATRQDLSKQEQRRLLACEQCIEKGMKTFIAVGDALLEIKQSKLYRQTHSTFESYCETRWGIGIRQSQRFINASKVVHNLKKDDQLVALPYSEYQVRSLATVPPKAQRRIWQELNTTSENVTGTMVEQAVQQYKKPSGFTAPPLPEISTLSDCSIHYKDARQMDEVASESVALVITSPPYFNYVEYSNSGIGSESSYETYLQNLKVVYQECLRCLIPDGTICINISNMKSRKDIEGKSFLYPLVADTIRMMTELGFIFFDEIIWVKGDANNGALQGKPLFGSYPYPPTPKILDSIFENILIFKKEGKPKNRVDVQSKELSRLSQEEWMVCTKGIWTLSPDVVANHPASFPMELPQRLIKIYSFLGETILDPFLGSGSTIIAANMLGRRGVGYEISKEYEQPIREKMQRYLNG